MPSSARPLLVLACLGLLAGGCSSSTGPQSISKTTGQVSDPTGDGGSADLTAALFEVAAQTATVLVNFSLETYASDSMLAVLDLDVDENPATGFTSNEAGYSGLGIDYRIEIGNIDPVLHKLGARIKCYQGGTFVILQDQPIAVNAGGYVASLSYDAFGDGDDRLAFRVESYRVNGDGTLTPRQDWAPDADAAPVTVR